MLYKLCNQVMVCFYIVSVVMLLHDYTCHEICFVYISFKISSLCNETTAVWYYVLMDNIKLMYACILVIEFMLKFKIIHMCMFVSITYIMSYCIRPNTMEQNTLLPNIWRKNKSIGKQVVQKWYNPTIMWELNINIEMKLNCS